MKQLRKSRVNLDSSETNGLIDLNGFENEVLIQKYLLNTGFLIPEHLKTF